MKFKSLALILAIAFLPGMAMAQQSKSDPNVEFRPHAYGQLMGGVAHTVGESAFTNLLSPAGAVNFGYQFTPVFVSELPESRVKVPLSAPANCTNSISSRATWI